MRTLLALSVACCLAAAVPARAGEPPAGKVAAKKPPLADLPMPAPLPGRDEAEAPATGPRDHAIHSGAFTITPGGFVGVGSRSGVRP